MWLFYYFDFERNYDVLKSKSPCFLLNKKLNFNKNQTESKLEHPMQLKVKLSWVEARDRKTRALFATLIFSAKTFFKICVISHSMGYCINFQNIHSFTYQKTLLHTLFCLFLKSSKAFSVSLKLNSHLPKKFVLFVSMKAL